MKKIKKDNIVLSGERPTLQFSVLCDGIATAQQMGNKPVFIGVFGSILRPAIIPQFFIANRWINGTGEHAEVVKILNPELKEITRSREAKISLVSKASSADVFNGFVNIDFPVAGVYWIKVELDGKAAISYPLPVFDEKE